MTINVSVNQKLSSGFVLRSVVVLDVMTKGFFLRTFLNLKTGFDTYFIINKNSTGF